MDVIERVRNLEAELAKTRQEASAALRETRSRLGLSLRQVGRGARLSHVTVYDIEKNKTWKTRAAQKIARFYSTAA